MSAFSANGYLYQGAISSTDNGNGTYTIPLFNADVPDVSVAYVPAKDNREGRDYYYMVSTTMHLSPGAPIMKSFDLVNWEIVDYVFDRLSIGDAFSLREGEQSYGNGQWAPSIRYHEGEIFVLFNTNNLCGAYMYHLEENEIGSPTRTRTWTRVAFGREMHDPTLFFDPQAGNTPYVFFGNGNQTAVELDPNDSFRIVSTFDDIFTQAEFVGAGAEYAGGLFEGSQLAYIDGKYYMVMITTGQTWQRQVVVLRSPYLLGRYDSRADGQQTYEIRSGMNADGFAQGCMVPVRTAEGNLDWHGLFFRDTFPVGRIPGLVPTSWDEGWPQFGIVDGKQVVTNGAILKHPIDLPPALANLQRTKSIVTSDDFNNDAGRQPWTYENWDAAREGSAEHRYNGSDLAAPWEWNHAPDNRYWSLTEREGWLRLRTANIVTGRASHREAGGTLTHLEEARNTLSQRTVGPQMSAETLMDVRSMCEGDTAGIGVYHRFFSYAGVRKTAEGKTLGVVSRTEENSIEEEFVPGTEVRLSDQQHLVHIKADMRVSDGVEKVQYYYSFDGSIWNALGNEVQSSARGWEPVHFMGPRWGLFNYATKMLGGYVDFDYFYLSDRLGLGVDVSRLSAAIDHGRSLTSSATPQELRDSLATALEKASAGVAAASTQNQVDALLLPLERSLAEVEAAMEDALS